MELDHPLRRDVLVIALVGLAHATSHLFHLLLPPLFPLLMPEFGLSFAEAGLLMTVFFTISGAGQAAAGFIVDRWGARRVLVAGISLLALSGLVLSLAASYAMLLLVAVLAGLGNSVFHPADFSLLNKRVSPARLGHAFSMHGLSGNLGWAAGAMIAGLMMGGAGWRLTGAITGGIALVSLVALLLAKPLLDDAAPKVGAGNTASASPAGGLFAFLRAPTIWLAFVFFLLVTGALGGLQSFAAPVLAELYAITVASAVAALTGYLLGSAGGMLAGGFIATRTAAHDRAVGIALASAAAFALLLASGLPGGGWVMPLMVAMGFGTGIAGPSRDLLVRKAAVDAVPGGRASPAFGRVYGFVYSGLDVGFALGPVAFGLVLDAGGRHGVLAGIAGLQILAVLTVLTMGRRVRSS